MSWYHYQMNAITYMTESQVVSALAREQAGKNRKMMVARFEQRLRALRSAEEVLSDPTRPPATKGRPRRQAGHKHQPVPVVASQELSGVAG